jgi:hypothetical protein
MLGEAHVMHVAPERLEPWPLRAKVVPLSVAVPVVMLFTCAVLSAHTIISPESLMVCHRLEGSTQAAWSET